MSIKRLNIAQVILPLSLCFVGPAQAAPETDAVTPLELRFTKLQSTVRSGQPAYALKIVSSDQSLFEQAGDGVVRIAASTLRLAHSSEMLDMILLTGLSQASYNPQRAERSINGAARIATDVLAFVGQTAAEHRVENHSHRNVSYEQVGKRREPNELPSPASLRPAQRAFIWAKSVGGCEARIVDGLKRMTKADAIQPAQDARRTLSELGPVAWSPNAACKAPDGDANYRALIAALPR